jgi:C-terminal processing protease CtpA/Prc
MRRAMMAVMTLCLAVPTARAQQSEQQATQRRELEQKMQQLEQQMRDLERELSRMSPDEVRVRATPAPAAGMFRLFSPHARLGVILRADEAPATDSIGAILTGVTPGGPADQAGLKLGDIITTFNGEKLVGDYPAAGEDESAPGIKLRDLAGDLSDGDTVKLDYRRGKETHRATIVARNLPESNWALTATAPMSSVHVETGNYAGDVGDLIRRTQSEAMASAMPAIAGTTWMYDRWFDMELVALNPELGDYFGTSTGLLVIHAPDDSTLNLRGGDVILAVDGRKPASQAQLIRILRSYAPGEQLHLDIMRQKHRTTVTAKIPERHSQRDRMHFDWQQDGILR